MSSRSSPGIRQPMISSSSPPGWPNTTTGRTSRSAGAFDAAVMLNPLPGAQRTFGTFGVSESAADYLDRLLKVAPKHDSHHDGTMLLLGGFPAGAATHQGVIEAVQRSL